MVYVIFGYECGCGRLVVCDEVNEEELDFGLGSIEVRLTTDTLVHQRCKKRSGLDCIAACVHPVPRRHGANTF